MGPAPGRGKPAGRGSPQPALLSPSQALSSAGPAGASCPQPPQEQERTPARPLSRSHLSPRRAPRPASGAPWPEPLTPASPRRAGEPGPRRPCLGRARRWPAAGSTTVSIRPTRPFPEGLQGPLMPRRGPPAPAHLALHPFIAPARVVVSVELSARTAVPVSGPRPKAPVPGRLRAAEAPPGAGSVRAGLRSSLPPTRARRLPRPHPPSRPAPRREQAGSQGAQTGPAALGRQWPPVRPPPPGRPQPSAGGGPRGPPRPSRRRRPRRSPGRRAAQPREPSKWPALFRSCFSECLLFFIFPFKTVTMKHLLKPRGQGKYLQELFKPSSFRGKMGL